MFHASESDEVPKGYPTPGKCSFAGGIVLSVENPGTDSAPVQILYNRWTTLKLLSAITGPKPAKQANTAKDNSPQT